MGFRTFFHDVEHRYLQRKSCLSRQVFIRLKRKYHEQLGLKERGILELEKKLYGLFYAGNYWKRQMEPHLVNDFRMKKRFKKLHVTNKIQ